MISPLLQTAELDRTIAILEDNYTRATVTLGSAGGWFNFAGASSSAELALTTARKSIDHLKGEMRAQVLSGARTYEQWKELAQATQTNLRVAVTNLPALSFSAAVINGVKAGAAEVAPWALGGAGLVVVGLVAFAFMWAPVRT